MHVVYRALTVGRPEQCSGGPIPRPHAHVEQLKLKSVINVIGHISELLGRILDLNSRSESSSHAVFKNMWVCECPTTQSRRNLTEDRGAQLNWAPDEQADNAAARVEQGVRRRSYRCNTGRLFL